MQMNDKVYDVLKYIALIVLPALGTFYSVLAGIWGLPYGDQITRTILAVDTLLGALVGVSSSSYYKKIQKANIETEKGA